MKRYLGTYGGLSEKEKERYEQLAEVRHVAVTRKVILEDLAKAKKKGNDKEVEKLEASLKRLEEIALSSVRRLQYVPKPIEEAKLDIRSAVKQAEKDARPSKEKLALMSTSDPDYYAENLLYEISEVHKSVIECFEDLKKHMTVIEKTLTTIKKSVKKK